MFILSPEGLSSQSIQSSSPSPSRSFLRNSLSRRCWCGASAPRVFATDVFSAHLFRIRTYEKRRGGVLLLTRNPTKDFCPQRPSGVRDLSFRCSIEGSGPAGRDPSSRPKRRVCLDQLTGVRHLFALRITGHSSAQLSNLLTFKHFNAALPLLTAHYSLLTSTSSPHRAQERIMASRPHEK